MDDSEQTTPKQPSWTQLQGELQSALNLWDDLTQKSKNKKSFEDKQIDEVRSLLKDLQKKLQDFDTPSET